MVSNPVLFKLSYPRQGNVSSNTINRNRAAFNSGILMQRLYMLHNTEDRILPIRRKTGMEIEDGVSLFSYQCPSSSNGR